jgi:hypothetical protein
MKIVLSIALVFLLILTALAGNGKWFVKGIFGAGVAFDDVSLHMTAAPTSGGSQQNVNIGAGGGMSIGGAVGYHLSPKYFIEADYCFQSEIEEPEVEDADGAFEKSLISLTFNGIFAHWKMFDFYFGGGFDYCLSPKLTRKVENPPLENEVQYEGAPGVHGVAGMQSAIFKTFPLWYFVELRVDAGMKYQWNKHTENGAEMPPFPDWEELNGDQMMFNFGLTYYFK